MGNRVKQEFLAGIVLPVIFSVGLTACEQEQPQQNANIERPVKLLTIGANAAGGTFEFPGSVSPAQESYLAFQVSGQIVEIPVDEGQFVAAGTVVARMDPRDYAAARDKAAAEREAAEAEYNRYAKAFESNAVTAQDLDVRKRNYEVSQAEFRTAQKAVDDTNLKAPFAGRIATKLVDDFATVQAKESILLLQDESGLQIKVNVPERDWAQAEPGLSNDQITERVQPRVELAAIPGRQFPASIREKASAADPVTRTYEVTLAFERPEDLNISPGMTAKVIITGASRTLEQGAGPLIPAGAVLADADNNPYVWIVEPGGNTVARRAIQPGKLTGDSIRVVEGLNSGDRVVVSGVNSLAEGMAVRELDR